MIPNVRDRELHSSGVVGVASFGISLKDSAHLMTILRDAVYSDKVLAVLREYGANAWDAHRSVGKMDLPIKVTLPTREEPTLCVRDYGPGLSHSDVFEVFTQYGASSKRQDDVTVGSFGIGSKSGFAYADSFTIVSRHAGQQRTCDRVHRFRTQTPLDEGGQRLVLIAVIGRQQRFQRHPHFPFPGKKRRKQQRPNLRLH